MTERYRVVNRDLNPLLTSLPAWARTIHPHQVRAVNDILRAFETSNLVFLDAPTGTGKTLIAEIVRRLSRARAVYACTTKSLQDQFCRDFEYARVMKGRRNYPTVNLADEFPEVSAEDCNHPGCSLCPDVEDCPYVMAKESARCTDLAILNTAYLLSETKGQHSAFRGWDMYIMDEADTVEHELMNHVSIDISQRRMERWGWTGPEKVTVPASWAEWLTEHVEKLEAIRDRHRFQGRQQDQIAYHRELRFLTKMLAGMRDVLAGLGTGMWVYTGTEGKGVSFKPSRVDQIGNYLWDIGKDSKWLLMSATPVSVDERLTALGWENRYETVRVDSTFPVENRRVRYVPVASLSAKNRESGVAPMADAIRRICDRHDDHRVLVHTHSYAISRDIQHRLKNTGPYPKTWPRTVYTYGQAREREDTLRRFLDTPAAILLAPSMDRGIDLPDDACRVQVITKVPYPYLGDRQVSARLHSPGGRTWYLCETVRSLVQSTGRAVRSKDDWAETWILDSDFESLWNRARGLFPRWWVDSLVWRPESLTSTVG